MKNDTPASFARSWVPLQRALADLAPILKLAPAATADLVRELLDDAALQVRIEGEAGGGELPREDQPRLLFNRETGRAWLAAEPGPVQPADDWGTVNIWLHWATLRTAAQLMVLPAAQYRKSGRPAHELKATALGAIIRAFGLGVVASPAALVRVMQDACIEAHPDNHPDDSTLNRWAQEIAATAVEAKS
jgi:hypothetical protein